MFSVKFLISKYCFGNDRDYYRKPKEFVMYNFKSKEEAEQFVEKQKAIHEPENASREKIDIYSDFEIIEEKR